MKNKFTRSKTINVRKKPLNTFIKLLLGGSILASSVVIAAQPNILVISMDDALQEQFGAFGSTVSPSPTPTIDALAAEGVRFTNAHTVAANCNPSRNVMLSGTYPHQNGVTGFKQVWKSPVPLLPKIMQDNGYITGLFGKDTHATPYFPFDHWDNLGDEDLSHDEGEFYTWASNAFSQAATANKPFFYMINTHDPHRKFWGINKDLVVNESQTPVPSHIYALNDIVVPPSIPALDEVKLETQYYYSTLRRGDDFVKEMLTALDESGMSDNTIVIFYADHGWAMPFAKTNIWNASTRTPLVVRWPDGGISNLDANGNEIVVGGMEKTEMVSVVDFLPTILEAAGIAIPTNNEGQSFLKLAKGETESVVVDRSKVFKTHYENSGGQRRPMRSVQSSQYDYIFNPWSNGTTVMKSTTQGTASFKAMAELANATGTALEQEAYARAQFYDLRVLEEFYDLAVDPYELDNKIDDATKAAVIAEFKQDMKDWMIRTNDPAMSAFVNMHDPAFLENWMEQQQAEADKNKLYPQLKKNAIDPTTFFYPHHDYYNIVAGDNLTVSVAEGLTSNDYDAVGATGMQVSKLSDPLHGTLTLNANGSFTYVPDANFSGTDEFNYQVNSVGTSDSGSARVYISVVGDSQTEVIFHDLFNESSLDSEWSNSGTDGVIETIGGAAYSGDYGARVKKGAKLERTFSTLGKKDVQVHYSRRTVGFETGETLTVEWSIDSVTWNTLEVTQDTAWDTKTFVLADAANDQANVTLRFNTNGDALSKKAEIDNVSVKAEVEATQPSVELVLLEDNFESNTLEGWSQVSSSGTVEVAGEAGHSSSFGARVKRGAIMQKTFATQGYTNFDISYIRQAIALEGNERLDVEWSDDGSTWHLIESVNTTSTDINGDETFSTNPVSNISVRFAVYSNKNVEKALIDNILIKGVPAN
ncbi:MAG: sulfatase-like hydrolase/transferase [Colwellia sp.]|nr:sulfatase-like hydrolase/transferase [Colwellia sp.]MCW8863672.1 sulfatase-like hydrolase/transferase [Colwellia sp.]MCW9082276.1 sulfatase-like hydrolase/transferase [Colwellia sp.]